VNQQWTVVGLHKGGRGTLDGAHLAASLRGLPLANVSGWYSGDFRPDQLRAIATHAGPVASSALPALSVKAAQQQLVACGFLIEVTGQLDDATREALRYFQTGWCGVQELESNGELTARTRLALAFAARNNGSLGRKAHNFRYQEFRLDNKGHPRVRRRVGLAAQAYRDRFGPTTILRSGSSVEHNKAVGGAPDSRHLYPDHWDAIDVSPQDRPVADITALGMWTGIGHHAASGFVDHLDLRGGDPHAPNVFPDR